MVGQIDVSPDGTNLLISFPYRPDLVEVVKTIPGRRWDKGSRTWKVPITEVELCVRTFMAHGFRLSPDVATALTSGGTSPDLGSLQLAKVEKDINALTISGLNLRVAEVLNQNFQEALWVVGELQNFKPKGRGRHRYFELVERNESDDLEDFGENDAPPRAVVEAVIFESAMTIINRRLRTAAQKIELADGLKVRVRGRVDLYQPRGKYQFKIEDIDPSYTLGEMLVRREKILAELNKLGLLEKNTKKRMPAVPLRVALVTAFDSDAYNDFVQTLARTNYAFQVTIFDCFVQGDRLRPSVTKALKAFARAKDDYDVLVITRGGGSRSDLGSWDDLDLAKLVAGHPLKAIIGIGHERDQSVLDHVAQSVKTPTAAGELLIETVRAYQESVEDTMLEIAERASRILRDEARELRARGVALGNLVRAGLAGARSGLVDARRRIARAATLRLRDEGRDVARRARVLDRGVFHRLEREHLAIAGKQTRLTMRVLHRFERESERLTSIEARTRAVDPVRVLHRGYAILRGDDGKALRSVRGQTKGKKLEATLADGTLDLRVDGS
ncbi:MAG: exodeoxyribonuclease VII large subunit [Planctomycetes bacterium]|nr:exodeoxyribonuclease VII large subunit [Planctomycetota bacterium]